jgi:hypothetical protein
VHGPGIPNLTYDANTIFAYDPDCSNLYDTQDAEISISTRCYASRAMRVSVRAGPAFSTQGTPERFCGIRLQILQTCSHTT